MSSVVGDGVRGDEGESPVSGGGAAGRTLYNPRVVDEANIAVICSFGIVFAQYMSSLLNPL